MKRITMWAGLIAACLMLSGCGPSAGDGKETQGQSASETVVETESGSVWLPGQFEWSGGSGKVEITCSQVREEGGQDLATITFSSPHYTYVRIGDEIYTGTSDEETSVFEIPVTLDEWMTIAAETTAMSQPHEIEYEIFVSLAVIEDDFPPDGLPDETEAAETAVQGPADFAVPEIEGLAFQSAMDPAYAKCFNVYTYTDGYQVLDVPLSGRYLLIPEGQNVPAAVPEDMIVIRQPLNRLYVAGTSTMSLFDAIGTLDRVAFTGTDVSGWLIEAPREALSEGRMKFAGKYSAPDYEMLLNEGCDLAVESTMIYHTPEVKEMLEDLGIPVFVDRSSYEKSALARMEWIRLYGALMGAGDRADAWFDAQAEIGSRVYEDTGLKVAWFSISQAGLVNVRASDDYIIQMIGAAGGRYADVDTQTPEGTRALRAVSMETFYACAADADYLIYSATISDKLSSIEDLVARDAVLADFKAVREGHVWQSDQTFYQATDQVVRLTEDIHRMLTGGDPAEMMFLHPVK